MTMLQHIGLIRVMMIYLTSDLLRYFFSISPSLSLPTIVLLVRKPAHIPGMYLAITMLFLVHNYRMLVTNIEGQ